MIIKNAESSVVIVHVSITAIYRNIRIKSAHFWLLGVDEVRYALILQADYNETIAL